MESKPVTTNNDCRWLNIKELSNRLGCGVSSIYRYMNDPTSGFPQPRKFGGGRCQLKWSIDTIEKWERGE